MERWLFPTLEGLPLVEWEGRFMFDPVDIGLLAYRAVDGRQGTYDLSLVPAQTLTESAVELQPKGRLSGFTQASLDPTGEQIAVSRGQEILVRPLEFSGAVDERRIGRSSGEVRHLAFSPDSTLIASSEQESERMYVWSVADPSQRPLLELDGNRNPDPLSTPAFSHDNSKLVMTSTSEASVHLWDLEVPLDGRPLILPKKDGGDGYLGVFHPEGHWLATLHGRDVALWPVGWPYVRSVNARDDRGFAWVRTIAFSPDSKWLASCSGWSGLHLWPLEAGIGSDRSFQNRCLALAYDLSGQKLLTGGNGFVALGDVTAEEPERLLESGGWFQAVAVDPTGQRIAAAPNQFLSNPADAGIWVWNSSDEEARRFDVTKDCPPGEDDQEALCLTSSLGFASDGSLYTGGWGGTRRWDLESGEAEWMVGPDLGIWTIVSLTPDGRYLLTGVERDAEEQSEVHRRDLETGAQRRVEGLPSAGVTAGAMDPTGQVLAVGTDAGEVWVREVSGGEPHLLLGLQEPAHDIEFSPDGRWIAAATDQEILLWPMPDLDKPPFHTLPYEELLTKLRSFTNVRAVEDPESSTGWSLDVGPFPGWQDHPVW